MKLMSFQEMVDRVRLPIDEFRKKYAPGSIEKDPSKPKTYSLKLVLKPRDGYAPAVVIDNVVGHELFVATDHVVQHLILLENNTQIAYQECSEQRLLQCIKFATPVVVEPVVETVTLVATA